MSATTPKFARHIKAVLHVTAIASCVCMLLYTPAAAAADATLIRNVRIFDGEDVIPTGDVLIAGGTITMLADQSVTPKEAAVIDGRGLTLLPGLYDAHTHVWAPDNLKQALVFGVTTVVDMFMDPNTMAAMKAAQADGQANDRAFLVSAGTLATVPGGHGTQYGRPIATLSRPEEAAAFVAARRAERSDLIKIIWDDGSTYGGDRPTFDKATVTALADAAHAQHVLTVIHAASLRQAMDALEAGVDGLAHLYFEDASDPDFGNMAARNGAFVIPTLSVLQGMNGTPAGSALLDDPDLAPFLRPNDVMMLKMAVPFQTEAGAFAAAQRAVAQLKAGGVSILAGTDAPNPGTTHGASLHGELELLVAAGLTPVEALRAATSVPARIFGHADRGRVANGYQADCVLVEGDPTTDITQTRRIVAVWRAGHKVDRDAYRAAIAAEQQRIAAQKKAPPPGGSESGWISNFEGDQVTAQFGAGWSVSTDAIMGGQSKAEYELVDGGAEASSKSLLITGTVSKESSIPWAGAFFSPGNAMMTPANLSHKRAISFWAKGDQQTFSIMVFARSLGYVPAGKTFQVGPEWRRFTFPYKDFNVDGTDIMGIFIGGAPVPGAFSLQIDNVRLE